MGAAAVQAPVPPPSSLNRSADAKKAAGEVVAPPLTSTVPSSRRSATWPKRPIDIDAVLFQTGSRIAGYAMSAAFQVTVSLHSFEPGDWTEWLQGGAAPVSGVQPDT